MTQTQPTVAQRVRLFLFEYLREHAVPPVVEQLMSDFELGRPDAVALLRELADARHIALVRGTSRILMAFPFSAIATPFRVIAGGHTYFANCAWDAIAFHAMLGTDIAIDSYCHHCAMPISIEMSQGQATRVEPADTIVYLGLRPAQWWDEIITTCSNTMVFFASPEHRDASDISASADQPDRPDRPHQSASLTPDQVHALGVPLYSRKLSIDYVRPGREQLMAHFGALGLTGPYWEL